MRYRNKGTAMVHIIPNVPFVLSGAALVIWLITSFFVVIPVHVSTTLISVCLVYCGSYISIFTKKVTMSFIDDP